MFSNNEHVIRGYSEREVELKVKNFIKSKLEKDEHWDEGPIVYSPARNILYKPYSCVLIKEF